MLPRPTFVAGRHILFVRLVGATSDCLPIYGPGIILVGIFRREKS